MNELVIFGSAEVADLAYFYFKNDSKYRVVAFTVDDEHVNQPTMCGLPLLPYSQVIKEFPSDTFDMHVALSYSRLNQLREEKYIQAKNSGYTLASYICSKSVFWPDLLHGDNCFVLENQTIQPSVKIGNNVVIWSGNHLGHGSRIGNHTYISSHVVISGNCVIGDRCFFGVNSTVKDFSQIGNDCFIAMDASITRDMPDGSIALGESAKFIDGEDRRAKVIKKKYFHF